MKRYFKVTFEYAEGIYCTNLAHAETAEDVEREYSKYAWCSVKPAQPWDVDEARAKGMPIIEVEPAQEAPETAPADDPAQQPTPADEAPQAAPQAAEQPTTTEQKEEDTPMSITPAERIQACNIIIRRGGYRERDLLTHPHTVTRGETWNEAHKVVEILATTPDPDGHRPGCAVDIVTRSIVG